MAARKRKEYGEYIVSDSKICGGDLIFKGTRVLVKDVLYYVAQGKDWDWIVSGYHGSTPNKTPRSTGFFDFESLTVTRSS